MNNLLDERLRPILKRMLVGLEQKVHPDHTALVIIDIQNDFCAQGGFLDQEGLNLSHIQTVAPRIADFLDIARNAGLHIIFVRTAYFSEDNAYLSDVWLEQYRRVRKVSCKEHPILEKGSWGAEFYGRIRPMPGEVVVEKHRYGAFAGTDLDLILRSKGVRTLILTGVATNVCVETTARDGFMKDYYIILPEDCCAALDENLHKNTLTNIDIHFGQVVNSKDLVACW